MFSHPDSSYIHGVPSQDEDTTNIPAFTNQGGTDTTRGAVGDDQLAVLITAYSDYFFNAKLKAERDAKKRRKKAKDEHPYYTPSKIFNVGMKDLMKNEQ